MLERKNHGRHFLYSRPLLIYDVCSEFFAAQLKTNVPTEIKDDKTSEPCKLRQSGG